MRKPLIALCLGAAVSLLPAFALAQTGQQNSGAESDGGGRTGRDPGKMRDAMAARFKKADANGDGKLTKAEAQSGMPGVAKNFDTIDADHDGFVTPAEIRSAMAKRAGERKGGSGTN